MWRLIFRQMEGGRGWRQFTTSSIHPQNAINKEENKIFKQIGEKTQETLKVRNANPLGQYLQLRHILNGKFWTHGHDIYDRYEDRGYSQSDINKGHLRAKKAIGDSLPLGHSSRSCSDTVSDKTSFPKTDFVSATAEDYEELMSISNGLFKGTDYVPFRYHEWLKEPQRRMFLAKCEGKVVGFITYRLDGNGTTAVIEGLRVALWIRGHGMAGLLVKFCTNTLLSDHPEVKIFLFTRAEDPPASLLARCKVITSKAVISVFLPADQLKTTFRLLESRVNNLEISKNVSVLGPEQILRFFEESKKTQHLLPGGLLIQGWFPFTTHKSNLNLMLKRQIFWIYSHPGDSSNSASSKVTVGCDGPHAYLEGFLSLGSPPYPVSNAEGVYFIDIDLFGNDPSCAKVHVLEQLKIAVQALPAGSSIICILYADQGLRTELVQLCEGLTPFPISKEQMVMGMELKG